MELPPTATTEILEGPSSTNDRSLNKQRWLRAWEESALTSEGSGSEAGSRTENPQETDAEQGERFAGRPLYSESTKEGDAVAGALSVASDRVLMSEGQTPAPVPGSQRFRDGKSQQFPAANSFAVSSPRLGQASGAGAGEAMKLQIERSAARHFPEVNVQVAIQGESVLVRIRDFRGDDRRLTAIVEKIKELILAAGLEAKSVLVNGRQVI